MTASEINVVSIAIKLLQVFSLFSQFVVINVRFFLLHFFSDYLFRITVNLRTIFNWCN